MNQTLSSTFISRLLNSRLITEDQLERGIAAAGDDEENLSNHLVQTGVLTRFQARQIRAGSTSLSVGNYVVVDFIGRGGSGIVLKAYHRLMPGRFVALKTVETRNLHASGEIAARFRREIEIVSKLDHPNVVRALDVIQTRGHLYLVLEYVNGNDLGKYVKQRGPLPVSQAVDFVIQAARGLGYAHRLGIVHRDLKPTNLLLTENNIVKISDLGLAKFYSSEADMELTMKGLALGTPDYMAPEQAEDSASVDPRTDLYSLGATLFHFLTGIPGVEGTSYFHKLQQLLTAPPRPLAEVRGDVPPELARIVDRLRSRNPADRPQSAEETIALLMPFAPVIKEKPQPLSPRQLAELVLAVIQGKKDIEVVCKEHELSREEFEKSQLCFIEAGFHSLDPKTSPPAIDESVQKLHARIGVQQMEIEELKKKLNGE